MPLTIYILSVGVFALTTSEYMVSGFLPALASDLAVSVVSAGYLVSIYAGAMAVGGPILISALSRIPRKRALLILVAIFCCGQVLGAAAPGYGTMVCARVITGVAASGFIGVALALGAQLVDPRQQGRAASVVLGGLMAGTVLGLPVATAIAEYAGWRASFWSVALLALGAGLTALRVVPSNAAVAPVRFHAELHHFRLGKLWAVFTTSLLVIGATFAAFTFFVPILTSLSGLAPSAMPLLLGVYGVATVLGNIVIGRLVDRFVILVLAVGSTLLAVGLIVFALFARQPMIAVACVLLVGLAGVPMNAAFVTRSLRVCGSSPLVNSVHTSFIMVGVMLGSWMGGLLISTGHSLVAPLWLGAGLAVLGLLSVLPELVEESKALRALR